MTLAVHIRLHSHLFRPQVSMVLYDDKLCEMLVGH